jgi:hypothetical protein
MCFVVVSERAGRVKLGIICGDGHRDRKSATIVGSGAWGRARSDLQGDEWCIQIGELEHSVSRRDSTPSHAAITSTPPTSLSDTYRRRLRPAFCILQQKCRTECSCSWSQTGQCFSVRATMAKFSRACDYYTASPRCCRHAASTPERCSPCHSPFMLPGARRLVQNLHLRRELYMSA